MFNFFKKERKFTLYIFLAVCLLGFIFCLPKPLFHDPFSTIINDNEGKLLGAQIAADGQWRFPTIDSVPYKFEKSIIYFEDQYFYLHPGINPVSISKALIQNIKAGRIVRGGSTIALQVIRLARKEQKRNILNKFIECIFALRLELTYSKKEILNLYASHAPFGGNLIGLEAASWRYYGRSPEKLSWGETATLAVLPNSPGLIYPGRNHEILLAKRNRLLDKLYKKKVIDNITCELSKSEPLPSNTLEIPQIAPHLLSKIIKDGNEGRRITTTINRKIQLSCNRIIENNHKILSQNEINNAAVIVLDVENGNVLAYVGNTKDGSEVNGDFVDIITSKRSSGSILKPFLFVSMLQEGEILPNTLVPDIPTQIAGYSPQNFDKHYDGAVHAGNALARSLNIPAVRMLQNYGLEKFYEKLQLLKFQTVDKGPGHYGLSIILGGAEIRLWDLVGAYAGLARSLKHYSAYSDLYDPLDYHPARYCGTGKNLKKGKFIKNGIFDAGSIWLTFEALTVMDRPMEGVEWESFATSQKIAWKTGTSYGHRDAWAVGITPRYVVGVWVGNADGEGRPGLTGISTAAPILFDVFKYLPSSEWFSPPYDDLIKIAVCRKSGYKAGPNCEEIDTCYVPILGIRTSVCPYHKLVHLNKKETFLVTSECYEVSDMVTKPWFILPPIMEWYYKSKDPYYKSLPAYASGCINHEEGNIDIIYPKANAKIFIPRGYNGQYQRIVFEVADRNPSGIIYWHLDNNYIGSTSKTHQMELITKPGIHKITLVSEDGEVKSRTFEVVEK
jgi:penicillin-binding protein 1C